MKALVIAAPSSGAGKTMTTLGLLRALRDRGVRVASAKSGPDYIDPRFHEAATGAPGLTLDAWAMTPDRLRALALSAQVDDGEAAELLLIEGAMGLFDGAPDGRGATADVAAALSAPVALLLDVAAQAQTAAAVADGLARRRRDVRVAGVLLNRVGSPRHAAMIRAAFDDGPPIWGALPRTPDLATPSRHLGLVQAAERPDLAAFVARAGRLIADTVDLDALIAAATPIPALIPSPISSLTPSAIPGPIPGPIPGTGARQPVATPLAPLAQRIAVAADVAFAFVYPHLVRGWRAAGAEISFFSPLADEAPDPTAGAVYLPGGYPELHAPRLATAARFWAGLRAAADRGAWLWGECGGYMVLGDGLVDADGARWPMAGLLRLETSFQTRRLSLGYRRLTPQPGAPWRGPLSGHEFHYSTALKEEGAPLFDAVDATGAALGPTGLRAGRVIGSYPHIIDGGTGAP